MTTEFFSSSFSNGLQVFHSQPWLMTDILAACQNYKTVQGEKKRKDKRWGWRAGTERKRKHGSHSMLRFCIFVSPEVNASVRNQRFEKLFSPSKLEGEPSACQDGARLKGCRPGLVWVTPGWAWSVSTRVRTSSPRIRDSGLVHVSSCQNNTLDPAL